jgi:ABC-2 type transport system permease protein
VSTNVAEIAGGTVDTTRVSRNQLLRIYYLESKYEFIRSLRNPGFGIPFLIVPVVLFVVFSAIGSTDTPRMMLFSGMAILGIMGPAMFGFGAILAGERQFGLLEFKRALPMPAGAHLAGKFCCALLYAAMVILCMIVASVLFTSLSLSFVQAVLVGLTLLLGVLPFCAIGFFIGTRVSAHLSNGITILVYLPQLYFSGLFFPLPGATRYLALIMPPFYLNQLVLAIGEVRHTFIGNAFVHVVVLVVLTAVLATLTARRIARDG